MLYLTAALLLTNALAFCLMGIDKRRAEKDLWRISERTLLAVCGLFAAAGGLAGMKLFRHKTRKPKFRFGVPLMLIAQLAIAAALLHAFGLPG